MKSLIEIDLEELKAFFMNLVDPKDVRVEDNRIVEYWGGIVMHEIEFVKEPKTVPQKYDTGDVIYCHDFADCPGCFYFDVEKPEEYICNECGLKTTLEEIKMKQKIFVVTPNLGAYEVPK